MAGNEVGQRGHALHQEHQRVQGAQPHRAGDAADGVAAWLVLDALPVLAVSRTIIACLPRLVPMRRVTYPR